MCKLGMISQERLKIEVKLPLNANRKSYMPRRLAQQRMTLSDLEWLFHTSFKLKLTSSASRTISAAVDELFVAYCRPKRRPKYALQRCVKAVKGDDNVGVNCLCAVSGNLTRQVSSQYTATLEYQYSMAEPYYEYEDEEENEDAHQYQQQQPTDGVIITIVALLITISLMYIVRNNA